MSSAQKYKAIFYALLLILMIVMFFVLRTPYIRIRSIVRTFNRWTDPAAGRGGLLKLLVASKYGTSRLKKIVDKNCKVIVEHCDGHVEYGTGYDYIDSLKGKWFVYNVDRILLSGPVIEPNDDGYIARITEFMYEKSEIGLLELELSIKKYDRKYLISEIKWKYKIPDDKELSKFQDMIKVRHYDPDNGFGGRYNESYTFSTPDFSPDGKKLVFSSLFPDSDIYIVNLDGSGLKRLTKTKCWEVLPQFTPDGKSIIFMSDKENYGGEYYIIDLDGSNYRRLVPDYFGVSEACFSPDGAYIAFTAQKGLSREVYLTDVDGTNIKQLTHGGNPCSSLTFAPDGKKLFFIQTWYDDNYTPPLNEEIFLINTDGTGLKQLTHARDENAHNKKILDITDDYVFYLHVTYAYDNIPIDKRPNYHEVWQMMYDGNAQKSILGGGKTNAMYEDVRVLPSGKAIVFVDDSENRYSYHLRIKKLGDFGKTLQLVNDEVYSKIAISPNGEYVAYTLLPRLLREAEIRGLGVVSVDGKESWTIDVNRRE